MKSMQVAEMEEGVTTVPSRGPFWHLSSAESLVLEQFLFEQSLEINISLK